MIGIHVRYQRSETTTIALQVANFLKAQGHRCSVLSLGARSETVDPVWDKEVVTDYKQDLDNWAKKCSHVIWFSDLSVYNIRQVRRNGAKTIIVASWDDPNSYANVYEHADKIVCMSTSLTNRLQGALKLPNVQYAPLAIPSLEPLSPLIIRPDRPRVLLNLKGSRKHQFGSMLIPTLEKWFQQIPAEWTIWAPKSLLHRKSWIFKCMKNTHSDSAFHYAYKSDTDTQKMLFGWHDITLWPTINCGHGLIILLSMTMGAPVITFDVPPANEYINGNNGILAPCQVCYSQSGTVHLKPDLVKYESFVRLVLTEPGTIATLRKHMNEAMEERYNLFKTGWANVLA